MKRRFDHTRDEAYSHEMLDTLERYSITGWELVAVVPWNTGTNGATLYFKRPVDVEHTAPACICPRLADYKTCPQHGAVSVVEHQQPFPVSITARTAAHVANEEIRSVLADIFVNTEALPKIWVALNEVSHDVTIGYEDMDEEWFKELLAASAVKDKPE